MWCCLCGIICIMYKTWYGMVYFCIVTSSTVVRTAKPVGGGHPWDHAFCPLYTCVIDHKAPSC